ncbi:MAG: hypothetical protein COB07_12420 [Sulfurovum sp.]|nr:MAG: hypothetical protein COB07_12420 [Sulfurovum sp.]
MPVKVQKVYTRFFEDCGLEKELFVLFLKLLIFLELEAPRTSQSVSLDVEVNAFIPEFDLDVSIKLKELVRGRAMPEYATSPTIRKETIFHIFGITKIEDLLPAPAQFEKLDNYIPREQERDIIKKIFNATVPVVIHASGGVGKSSFAQNIVTHLPKNCEIVIFDGFANGSYRSAKDQRHLHKNGLVQIINEFAFRGLCLPILPRHADSDSFLKIFYSRLKDIILEIKRSSDDAFVLIVLDAADNSEMASKEYTERASFVKDLLQDMPLDGCKIVALARTERLSILDLSHVTLKIELKSFSEEETKRHLKTKFTEIDNGQLIEFHKLTFRNPRVQFYFLQSKESLKEILKRLGEKGLSSDKLIESQLESSIATIKEQSYTKEEIDTLCKTLTLLPPMVPIEILEVSTDISKHLIYSFVSDMGAALLIKEDSVQFRDEPVESWFRETFKPSEELYNFLAKKLTTLYKTDPYVAMTLPRILYGAKEYHSLYTNAYNSSDIEIDDPVQRERIILENITYAIKLAKQEKDFTNLTKLLLEASKVIASKERHSEFIFANSDLIATLVGSEFINDFLYRGNSFNLNGILYAHSSLMLSMEPKFKAEARSFLRLTNEYLIEWSRLSDEKRSYENNISNKDIANIVLSVLYLFDEKNAISELNRWRLQNTKVEVIGLVVEHLIEQNQDKKLTKLLEGLDKYPYLLCASVIKIYQSGKKISKKDIERSLIFLLTQKKSEKLYLTVISIIELSILNDIENKSLIALLEKFFPPLKNYAHKSHDGIDERDLLLRYVTLYKVLKDELVDIDDFIPDDCKDKEELNVIYGKLYQIYELRAKLLCKNIFDKEAILSEISSQMKRISSDSWRYSRSHDYRDLPFLTAYVCIDINTSE